MKGENNNNATASGIGITGLLGVAFIVLKLCDKIDWPWIWVLAPIWIPFSVGVLVLIVMIIAAVILGKK